MDYSFQGRRPPPQLVAMVANTNAAYEDKKCYDDSSTNAHITPDLDNLNIQKPFQNTNTVAMGNGASLIIANNGSTILHSSHHSKSVFNLKKNVLHYPNASTNIISIQQFCLDNACYFILIATHFYIIDLQTITILLERKRERM
jgi:hypothetical protein